MDEKVVDQSLVRVAIARLNRVGSIQSPPAVGNEAISNVTAMSARFARNVKVTNGRESGDLVGAEQ